MIFRRSLVRELTATTIGLFLVLLAILFTQSVIRILGRAAAVRAGGAGAGHTGQIESGEDVEGARHPTVTD